MSIQKLASGKPNILVTGGAGFIGSHLCDELVKENHVICLDNFITGQEQNIDHLLKNPDFEFIKHDLTEPLEIERFPELKKFEIKVQGTQEIYHLACPTSPKEYNKLPIETLLANSHGTKNALDLALKYKAKFLFLSSSAIYGEPKENKLFKEDYFGFINPLGPRSCYNEGKRFAESLVVNYKSKLGVETKIVRVFNTYGPRMKLNDGRMIPDFIKNALNQDPIIIYGTEESTSTFCYISDLIDGILRMMKSGFSGPINLGSTKEYKMKDIAQKIIEFTSSSSKIEFREPLPYIAKQGVPEISLAREKLGFMPMISLKEGLKKTIDYMKAYHRLYDIKLEAIK